ncbi:MAG: carbohydrate ABC transporter permease [Treponema sp.]|jgi:ABC-type glycerol-3-phosphate transport system permease component|nr:carbohydrate ABC transporter permease [Treponema sp.]
MSSFQGMKINPKKFHISQLKFYLVIIPIALFMTLPIIYILNQAFKPLDELFRFPPTFIARRPTMQNFRMIMSLTSSTGIPMSRFLINTIIVTVVTAGLSILITAMSAYAFSKKKFRAREWLFKLNQAALMFVPAAVGIPRYLIIVKVGLNNNFLVHILPLLVMPVALFLVKQFVDQVPDSLIESARLDGAGEITVMSRIVFPLIMPALATVGILCFQIVWGATEASNLYLVDDTLKSFAFYLSSLANLNTPAMAGVQAAASLIMFLPNLIIFIAMQSRVMNTMSHSGIK